MDLPLFLLSSHFNTELQEYYTMTSNPSASLEHVAAQAFAATGTQSLEEYYYMYQQVSVFNSFRFLIA